MNDYKAAEKCFLCHQEFQYEPHAYHGKHIGAWGIMVCHTCFRANHDGIVPENHPTLVAHLKARGISPSINVKGWIEWPLS